MATYTERVEYKEEILPDQTIQLRVATVIERDGVEVGRQYHRSVFNPGADLSKAPEEVKAIANALWSSAVIEAYEEKVNENNLDFEIDQTDKRPEIIFDPSTVEVEPVEKSKTNPSPPEGFPVDEFGSIIENNE